MAAFCFIHGAWHGGWCWEPLTGELEARRHETRTPTLPSDDPDADIADWVRAVGSQADAVVVAHSFGGFVLPLVAARAHVYLCAFIPSPGQPPSAVLSDALDPTFGGTERDDLGRSYWPALEVAAEQLYRGHDRGWAEWAFPQLRPQSQTVARQPSPIEAFPRTSSVVLARSDPAVLPEWLRARTEAAFGVQPHEVGGGHFPMFDRTRELADVLESVLEDLP